MKQHTHGMHEHHTQQAIAQMPQITGPDAFGTTAVGELSKDRIDAIADPSEHRTPTVSSLRTGFAEGSLQDNADFAQSRLQSGKPVVAVAHQQPTGVRGQVPDDLTLMHIGRSQVHLGNDSRPTQAYVQAKAIKRLPTGMVFAKAGHVYVCRELQRTVVNKLIRIQLKQSTYDLVQSLSLLLKQDLLITLKVVRCLDL